MIRNLARKLGLAATLTAVTTSLALAGSATLAYAHDNVGFGPGTCSSGAYSLKHVAATPESGHSDYNNVRSAISVPAHDTMYKYWFQPGAKTFTDRYHTSNHLQASGAGVRAHSINSANRGCDY